MINFSLKLLKLLGFLVLIFIISILFKNNTNAIASETGCYCSITPPVSKCMCKGHCSVSHGEQICAPDTEVDRSICDSKSRQDCSIKIDRQDSSVNIEKIKCTGDVNFSGQKLYDCKWVEPAKPPDYCCCKDISLDSNGNAKERQCVKIENKINKIGICNPLVFDVGNNANPEGEIVSEKCMCKGHCSVSHGEQICAPDTEVDRSICDSKSRQDCSIKIERQMTNNTERGYNSFNLDEKGGCSKYEIYGPTSANDRIKNADNFLAVEQRAQDELNPMKFTSPNQIIGWFIMFFSALMGGLSMIMYIWAGVLWMTAAGNSERTSKARHIMLWTTLAVIVELSAYMLVKFVLKLVQ